MSPTPKGEKAWLARPWALAVPARPGVPSKGICGDWEKLIALLSASLVRGIGNPATPGAWLLGGVLARSIVGSSSFGGAPSSEATQRSRHDRLVVVRHHRAAVAQEHGAAAGEVRHVRREGRVRKDSGVLHGTARREAHARDARRDLSLARRIERCGQVIGIPRTEVLPKLANLTRMDGRPADACVEAGPRALPEGHLRGDSGLRLTSCPAPGQAADPIELILPMPLRLELFHFESLHLGLGLEGVLGVRGHEARSAAVGRRASPKASADDGARSQPRLRVDEGQAGSRVYPAIAQLRDGYQILHRAHVDATVSLPLRTVRILRLHLRSPRANTGVDEPVVHLVDGDSRLAAEGDFLVLRRVGVRPMRIQPLRQDLSSFSTEVFTSPLLLPASIFRAFRLRPAPLAAAAVAGRGLRVVRPSVSVGNVRGVVAVAGHRVWVALRAVQRSGRLGGQGLLDLAHRRLHDLVGPPHELIHEKRQGAQALDRAALLDPRDLRLGDAVPEEH
eukprot:scaffold246_cov242-Pinguiococcus_pyrenoidosus.AAC.3